jgi:hypothetical protein
MVSLAWLERAATVTERGLDGEEKSAPLTVAARRIDSYFDISGRLGHARSFRSDDQIG